MIEIYSRLQVDRVHARDRLAGQRVSPLSVNKHIKPAVRQSDSPTVRQGLKPLAGFWVKYARH